MSTLLRQTFVIIFFCCLGCSSGTANKSSYLLIAIEKFPFNANLCSETIDLDHPDEAFDLLCNDAIRFTHMFTPSTQSQAALSSILTGLYPHEHKVWHNGSVFLNETTKTVTEVFYEKGWRTSLISGGGAIWRKSGLAQGFTYFDDTFPIHWNSYYRPAKQVVKNFFAWLGDDETPFFTVLYLPDLLFPSIATRSVEGEVRESSYDGQYRYLLEALGALFESLKKKNQWYNTNVLVFGLNGKGNDFRKNELDSYNLYSENSQVAFFFKPAGVKKDHGHSWKVDNNYSLVDLGFSLFRETNESPNETMFESVDILKRDYTANNSERWILIESAWPEWKNLSGTRFSLRNKNRAYIFDKKIKLYSTLIDRLEVNPQFISWEKIKDTEMRSWVQSLNLKPWQQMDSMKILKWKLGRKLWDPYDIEQSPEDFYSIFAATQDIQTLEWLATMAIKQEKWESLENAGRLSGNNIWQFVARYNLRNLTEDDWNRLQEPCVLLFLQNEMPVKNRQESINCTDPSLSLLYKWIHTKGEEREIYRELLVRKYLEKTISDNIHKLNYIADLSWDMSLRYPSGPSLIDLILSLNKFKTYYNFIKKRMEYVQNEKVVY